MRGLVVSVVWIHSHTRCAHTYVRTFSRFIFPLDDVSTRVSIRDSVDNLTALIAATRIFNDLIATVARINIIAFTISRRSRILNNRNIERRSYLEYPRVLDNNDGKSRR